MNTNVTTSDRSREAIRQEVILAAQNYLTQRLDIEQTDFVRQCSSLLASKTMAEFVKYGIEICQKICANECNGFANGVCEQWSKIEQVPFLPDQSDHGAFLSHRLRQLLSCTSGSVKKVLASIIVIAPHSMQAERMVSAHNKLVTAGRSSFQEDTINSRLYVALNGDGTASFDPKRGSFRISEKEGEATKNATF